MSPSGNPRFFPKFGIHSWDPNYNYSTLEFFIDILKNYLENPNTKTKFTTKFLWIYNPSFYFISFRWVSWIHFKRFSSTYKERLALEPMLSSITDHLIRMLLKLMLREKLVKFLWVVLFLKINFIFTTIQMIFFWNEKYRMHSRSEIPCKIYERVHEEVYDILLSFDKTKREFELKCHKNCSHPKVLQGVSLRVSHDILIFLIKEFH